VQFREITLEESKKISEKNRLKPAKVIGTDILRFMKKSGGNLHEISWDEFEKILKENNLAIYLWKDWMKIMKKK
jgi:hypothetical protein